MSVLTTIGILFAICCISLTYIGTTSFYKSNEILELWKSLNRLWKRIDELAEKVEEK